MVYFIFAAVAVSITVFAWIFTSWALLAVTPVYLYMVRGLENADFVKRDMDEIAIRQSELLASASQAVVAPSDPEQGLQSASVQRAKEKNAQAKEHVV